VAFVTAAICVAIWIVVRDDPAERGYLGYASAVAPGMTRAPVWQGLREVLRYRNTWLIYFAPQGISGSTIAFGGLWGVPYLVSVYGFSSARAAFYCSALMLAWALGGPLFGAFSDRLRERKPLYVIGAFSALVLWSIIVVAQPSPNVLLVLLLAAGFTSGCMVIGFAHAKESVPARLAGTATGVANMGSMTGPMLLQPLIGVVLDQGWLGDLAYSGARPYDAYAWRDAFLLLLAWLAVSFVCVLATRETHARQLR
jgi:MFS family permease